MVWIEEIKLRTAINKNEKARRFLSNSVLKMNGTKGLIKAKVYGHAHLANDFSMQLVWDADSFKHQGSKEGMDMREILKQFGLVNYSIWKETV